jgi:transposase, IS5 family
MGKGFGRIEKRRQQLEGRKDKLRDLNEMVPWEVLRSVLEQLPRPERKSNAGRKAIDMMVLFKLLILKHLYNLSNEAVEYQAHDRASFRRFLGLSEAAEIPDATTLDGFEQRLRQAGLIEVLFEQFEGFLRQSGYEAQGGQIIDATLIPVPVQRNSREENEQIKQGEIPEDWIEQPHKLAQKDTDARWTQKNGQNYFGYKDHITIDVDHGFIRRYSITDASVHDSQALGAVLDPDNGGDEVWADSAYRSQNIEAGLDALGHQSQIHERAYRNHPLTEAQIASNREKSKTRAKVEHVFGNWVMTMGGKLVRAIGLERVRAQLGLKNLVYNLKRYVFWQKRTGAISQAQCV